MKQESLSKQVGPPLPFRSKSAAIFLGERHGGFGGADAVAVRLPACRCPPVMSQGVASRTASRTPSRTPCLAAPEVLDGVLGSE
jgi:hypothetical protein